MRKLFIMMIICLYSGVTAYAEEVQPIEAELSGGITLPVSKFYDSKKIPGFDFGIELRFNIPGSSWDCGLALNATTAVYEFKDILDDLNYKIDQSNRSIGVMFVGDYNFCQGKKVNPYTGIGIGISLYEPVNNWEVYISGTAFAFQPRIGVELLRHFRIELFSYLCRKGCNNIGLSFGIVIGGRPK